MRVAVIVLGDLGRSPRMQYHAAVLAREIAEVDVIALRGKAPIAELVSNPNVRLHLMPALDSLVAHAPRFVRPAAALLRMLIHSVLLGGMLVTWARRADVILVQNPPAFPAVPLALLLGRLTGAKVVVDWHNLTSAMAALKVRSGVLLSAVRRAEELTATRADAALVVSEALGAHLTQRSASNVTVFRDWPWHGGHEADRNSGRRLLASIAGVDPDSLIAVSATSWSADEETDWILDAAMIADRILPEGRSISLVVTGDGPRRHAFEQRVQSVELKRVRIATAWLSPDEYRDALAGADLGISLHRSASGLDFPMKIADMGGAALPVCVLDCGSSLHERLQEDAGIRFFTTAAELAERLAGFAVDRPSLESFRREVPRDLSGWDEEWTRVVEPIVTRLAVHA